MVVPLREELSTTDIRLGSVVSADPDRNVISVESLEGQVEDLHYDQLIVALGSVSKTYPVPGLAEHAMGFKALPEAIELRNRVLRCLEAAETLEDPVERGEWLSFVFVGAGYAGLEGLAELQDFAADVIDLYPRCRTTGMRWMLVEAKERVMTEIEPSLAEFAQRELRSRGIEICVNTSLSEVTPRSATLSDGRVIPARTVVWTTGSSRTPSSPSSACRPTRAAASSPTATCGRPVARTSGRSVTRPRCPIRPRSSPSPARRPRSTRCGRVASRPATWRRAPATAR